VQGAVKSRILAEGVCQTPRSRKKVPILANTMTRPRAGGERRERPKSRTIPARRSPADADATAEARGNNIEETTRAQHSACRRPQGHRGHTQARGERRRGAPGYMVAMKSVGRGPRAMALTLMRLGEIRAARFGDHSKLVQSNRECPQGPPDR